MTRGPLAVAVALTLTISVALAPVAGAFGSPGGRGGVGGRPQPAFKGSPPGFKGITPRFNGGGLNRAFPGQDRLAPGFRGFPGLDVHNRGFNHGFKGPGGFGAFVPWWGWGATTTVWAPPLGYDYGYGFPPPTYAPTTYYAPTYYPPLYPAPQPYAPGGSVSVAPVPPPPSVVAFPGGRYELRGDGVSSPYQWVWVADQPPVPPAPPTAPPAASAPAPGGQTQAAENPPARRSQLYRWIDEQGVTHWTNQADAVPEQHRARARLGPSS